MPQKVIVDKTLLIRPLSIFSELEPYQIAIIAKKAEFFEYQRDEFVYKEGDPQDAFYLIISGRARVFTKRHNGEISTLEYLHRGAFFGIISLLTNEPHSTSVQIINDSIILRINKEDFYFILRSLPQLAVHVSSTLARRLKRKDLGQKIVFESTIISVYGIQKGVGSSLYALNLAEALRRETKKGVIVLDMARSDSAPAEFLTAFFDEVKVRNSIAECRAGVNILRIPYGSHAGAKKAHIVPLLSYLTNIFDYCVIDLPSGMDELIMAALNQSDLIHLVTDNQAENINSVNRLIAELEKALRDPERNVKVVVNEFKGALDHPEKLRYRAYATLVDKGKNELGYNLAVRRVAREIGEVLVGIALGSGAAWGLSLIGVIKVLERERLPVDVVSGSSMGALIGAFWAAGNSGADMERIAIENKKQFGIFSLRDLKFPLRGLISDAKVLYFLHKYLGESTFKNIKFPLKIVATRLEDRKEVVIDSGGLAEAVRSSISIPGVYAPVRQNGGYLIDGGIINPVPVSVLLRMNVRKIIAVNTLPGPDDVYKILKIRKERSLKEEAEIKTRPLLKQALFMLRKEAVNFFTPNIMDIITKSIESLEYSMAETNCRHADVAIHPDFASGSWQDFMNPEKLISAGEEACLRQMPEIKRLIEEE